LPVEAAVRARSIPATRAGTRPLMLKEILFKP